MSVNNKYIDSVISVPQRANNMQNFERKAKPAINKFATLSTLVDPKNPNKKLIAHSPDFDPTLWRNKIYDDANVAAMLRQKRRNLLGNGIICPVEYACDADGIHTQYLGFNEVPEVVKFIKRHKRRLNGFLRAQAVNLVFSRMTGVILTLDANGNGLGKYGDVIDFQNVDACDFLAVEMSENDKEVKEYALISEDANKQLKYTYLPAYDPANPHKHRQVFLHTKDHLQGNQYYCYPDFVGTDRTLRIRKEIERYHLNQLESGFSIRYQIQVPKTLVDKIYNSVKADKSNKTFEQVRDEIFEAIENKLKGSENSASNIFNLYDYNENESIEDIRIKRLDDIKGDTHYVDLIKVNQLFNGASFDNVNALNGVGSESKLSSGSEVRNFANLEMTVRQNDDRNLLLNFMYVIAEINGWHELYPEYDIYFKIPDVSFTTTDVNKTGVINEADGGQ